MKNSLSVIRFLPQEKTPPNRGGSCVQNSIKQGKSKAEPPPPPRKGKAEGGSAAVYLENPSAGYAIVAVVTTTPFAEKVVEAPAAPAAVTLKNQSFPLFETYAMVKFALLPVNVGREALVSLN